MEDEEVVLHNSPLDTYLEQVTDMAFPKYQCNFLNHDDTMEGRQRRNMHEKIRRTEPFWLQYEFSDIFGHFRNFFNNRKVKKAKRHVLKTCSVLLDSNLLHIEDKGLLRELVDDVSSQLSQSEVDQQYAPFIHSGANIGTRFILFGVLCAIASFFILNVSFYGIVFYLVVMTTIFTIVSYIHYNNSSNSDEENMLIKTSAFVQQFEKLDQLIDKCIAHLKEVEVINHGVPFFRNKIPGTDIFMDKTRKCLKLRQCLCEILTLLFLDAKKHTVGLLRTQHKELMFYKEEFVSILNIDTFSDILFKEEKTESFKVVALDRLKSLTYLYRIVLSEFVLCTIVSISSTLSNTTTIMDTKTDILLKAESLQGICNLRVRDLQATLDKSMKDIFFKVGEKMDAGSKLSKENNDTSTNIESSLKSCKLNLFSALSRTEEFEKLLSGCNREKIDIEYIETLMVQFNLSLDNAKSCMEDILDHHRPKELTSADEVPNEDNRYQLSAEDPVMFMPSKEEGDQMFEGESRGGKPKEIECDDLDELQRKAKESRESRKLLRELKTIFAVKESPIGLMQFPLEKPNVEHGASDYEDENSQSVLHNGNQKICNKGFEIDSDDIKNAGELQNILEEPVSRICLPPNFQQSIFASSLSSQTEEIFGASSDEEAKS